MLHLALVSNLMTAIGAAPVFGRPNFPQRSGYFPAGVQLDLLPFGEQALRHFLFLERPEGIELDDAAGFVLSGPAREPVQPATARSMSSRARTPPWVPHMRAVGCHRR
jgi:hypothetical protein